jgi:DNA-binding response OmpR family regulator
MSDDAVSSPTDHTLDRPRRRALVIRAGNESSDDADGVAAALSAYGCDVALAYNGARIAERVRAWVPHIVVVDLRHGSLATDTILRDVRDGAGPTPTPVLAIVPRRHGDAAADALRSAGFTRVMIGPEDPVEIVVAARKLMRESTTGRPASLPSASPPSS